MTSVEAHDAQELAARLQQKIFDGYAVHLSGETCIELQDVSGRPPIVTCERRQGRQWNVSPPLFYEHNDIKISVDVAVARRVPPLLFWNARWCVLTADHIEEHGEIWSWQAYWLEQDKGVSLTVASGWAALNVRTGLAKLSLPTRQIAVREMRRLSNNVRRSTLVDQVSAVLTRPRGVPRTWLAVRIPLLEKTVDELLEAKPASKLCDLYTAAEAIVSERLEDLIAHEDDE